MRSPILFFDYLCRSSRSYPNLSQLLGRRIHGSSSPSSCVPSSPVVSDRPAVVAPSAVSYEHESDVVEASCSACNDDTVVCSDDRPIIRHASSVQPVVVEDSVEEDVRQPVIQQIETEEANTGTQSRRWVFTINNPTELDEAVMLSLVDEAAIVYVVGGREVGENGTPHIQGFVVFNRGWRFSRVKTLLGGRCYLAMAKGI